MALRLYDKARQAVRQRLLRRLLSCKELAPVLSQSLERALTLRERVRLRLHLLVCVWCVRYLAQLRIMRASLRARAARVTDDTPAAGPALSLAARTRLKSSLQLPER